MGKSKRAARGKGETLVRCAPVLLKGAIADDGEHVGERLLTERVGWLIDLAAEIAASALAERWNETDLDLYLSDDQPQFAYKAWGDTFGWPVLHTSDSYAPSRVGWMGLEAAGRTLRSSGHRRAILAALLAHQPPPAGADAVSLHNCQRRLSKFALAHGRPPVSFLELEPTPPRVARQALLAPTDRQLCEIDKEASEIRLLLPTVVRPATPRDWSWHAIPFARPRHLAGAACKPTLRIAGRRLYADMPFERPAPPKGVLDLRRALSCDWGLNTPMTGSVVWTGPDGKPHTSGRPVHFKADGLLGKLGRLARHIEELSAQIDDCSRRLRIPVETPPEEIVSWEPAAHKRAVLWRERERVSASYEHLLDQFAHAVSRWVVEQALGNKRGVVILEDLRTLEPKIGKKNNFRMTLGLRGKIADHTAYKAAEAGMRVLTVDPRGTSSCCSRCGAKTRHYTCAEPGAHPGYIWMRCPGCGASLERDHASSERIGGRGLSPTDQEVARVATPPPPQPDPRTAPARGQRAKIRRTISESISERLRARSVVTPLPAATNRRGHRSAEVGPEAAMVVVPAHSTFDHLSSDDIRPPRRLDGMRSAYSGLIRCTPVYGAYLSG